VFAEGNQLGNDLSVFLTAPISGVNIVASPHHYPPTCSDTDTGIAGAAANWAPTAADYPIVVGEFGSSCVPGGAIQMANMIATLTKQLPAWGWIAFDWSLDECSLHDTGCRPAVTDTPTLEASCTIPSTECAALASAPNTCEVPPPPTCHGGYGVLADYVVFAPSPNGQPVFDALQAAALTQTELGLAGQPG
jgi:hypothetical protein